MRWINWSLLNPEEKNNKTFSHQFFFLVFSLSLVVVALSSHLGNLTICHIWCKRNKKDDIVPFWRAGPRITRCWATAQTTIQRAGWISTFLISFKWLRRQVRDHTWMDFQKDNVVVVPFFLFQVAPNVTKRLLKLVLFTSSAVCQLIEGMILQKRRILTPQDP